MVCLDMDRSFTCDPGEPSTISSNDGRHQLNVSHISAGVLSASQVLTYVPKTAFDSDDAGKSLEEAGRLPFYMAAPVTMHNVGANGTVSTGAITPFSTLVATQVLYKGMTLSLAQQRVRSILDLPSTQDLTADFMRDDAFNMHVKAKILTVMMSEAQAGAVREIAGLDELSALRIAFEYTLSSAGDFQRALLASGVTPDTALAKAQAEMATAMVNYRDLHHVITQQTSTTPLSGSALAQTLERGIYQVGFCATPSWALFESLRYAENCEGEDAAVHSFSAKQPPEATMVWQGDIQKWVQGSTTNPGLKVFMNGLWQDVDANCPLRSRVQIDEDAAVVSCNGIEVRNTFRVMDIASRTWGDMQSLEYGQDAVSNTPSPAQTYAQGKAFLRYELALSDGFFLSETVASQRSDNRQTLGKIEEGTGFQAFFDSHRTEQTGVVFGVDDSGEDLFLSFPDVSGSDDTATATWSNKNIAAHVPMVRRRKDGQDFWVLFVGDSSSDQGLQGRLALIPYDGNMWFGLATLAYDKLARPTLWYDKSGFEQNLNWFKYSSLPTF